jgi:hypothetical protein
VRTPAASGNQITLRNKKGRIKINVIIKSAGNGSSSSLMSSIMGTIINNIINVADI